MTTLATKATIFLNLSKPGVEHRVKMYIGFVYSFQSVDQRIFNQSMDDLIDAPTWHSLSYGMYF